MSETAARHYADVFDRLRPDNLSELKRLLHPQVRFKDPFSDISGAEAVIGLMRQMFEDTTDPRFETAYTLCSGRTALLKWRFRCSVRQLGDIEFDGISEIVMDDDGLITSHIDYWDAGSEIYAKVPVLGRAVDFVRRRLAYRGG